MGDKKNAVLIGLLSATLGLEHIQAALPEGLLDSKADKFNATMDEVSPRVRRELYTKALEELLKDF